MYKRQGLSGLKQCAVDELHLDESGITLVCKGEHTAFLYADYNYENIEDTDCLPAVDVYKRQDHPRVPQADLCAGRR